ncbi:MAG: ABC transporter substrate-binding protein [Spirochaetota bacterium]
MRRTRRLLVVLSIFGVMATMLAGCAGDGEPTYTIGIVSGFAPFSGLTDGFIERMGELGYRVNENTSYEIYDTVGGSEEERAAIAGLVEQRVDLIYTYPTGTTIAAKSIVDGAIPIVFGLSGVDGNGLIQSVRRPGGNITGFRVPSSTSVVKRLEYLLEVIPDASAVYTAYNSAYPPNETTVADVRHAARGFGVTLLEDPVTSLADLKASLASREASGHVTFDGILVVWDDLTQSADGWSILSSFAWRHRLPISGGSFDQMMDGGVIAYVADFPETGRLAAVMADRILRGTSAGTIPIGTAEMALYVNYRRARELGLTVPMSLLNIANEVVR